MDTGERLVILSPRNSQDDGFDKEQTYLWGYQPHHRITISCAARTLFKTFGDDFKTDAYIVAVKTNEKFDGPRIVIEPRDEELTEGDFEVFESWHNAIKNSTPKPSFGYHEGDERFGKAWAERNETAHARGVIRESIQKCIGSRAAQVGLSTHVSRSIACGPYTVYVVLLVSSFAVSKCPRLQISNRNNQSFYISLLDAAIGHFCDAAAEATELSIANNRTVSLQAAEVTMREAAKSLLFAPFLACNEWNAHGAFDTFNEISSLTYERKVGSGKLLLVRRHHENIRELISFLDPIDLTDYRSVRKLLQLTTRHTSLLSDGATIFGIGEQVGEYDYRKEDLYTIEFVGQFKWQLLHQEVNLLRVEYGRPMILDDDAKISQFTETFKRVFRNATTKQISTAREIARSATKLKQGTIIVLSDDAEAEANRFANHSSGIVPRQLDSDFMDMASRIDGAILADKDGICFAIGVILDGVANDKGRKDRGARYNSSIRYVSSREKPTLALIVLRRWDVEFCSRISS